MEDFSRKEQHPPRGVIPTSKNLLCEEECGKPQEPGTTAPGSVSVDSDETAFNQHS